MKKYERPVTPAEVGGPIQSLVSELVRDGVPQYVPVEPLAGEPPDECFELVKRRVADEGGEALIGWALWELPGLFVEAEFHSVWSRPDGTLIDIAPKKDRSAMVLFLHDPSRTYEGRQVNNVRRPIVNDPALLEYLKTFDAEFQLMNRGERVGQHGEIKLLGGEAAEYESIQMRRAHLHFELLPRFPYIGPYTPCPCGSGKKVKWCHRDAA